MYSSSYPAASPSQSKEPFFKIRLTAWAYVLIYQCFVMALPALKLLHVSSVSTWSWGWVTMPVWAPSALLALVLGAERVMQLGKAKADAPHHEIAMETSAASY